MMPWYGPGPGAWGLGAMGLVVVLFGALLVAAVVLVARHPTSRRDGRRPAPPGRPTPQQTLAQRFARGEIDEPEYRRRLAVLRTQPPPEDGA